MTGNDDQALWSAQQYQWLSALGHTIYLRADEAALAEPADDAVAVDDSVVLTGHDVSAPRLQPRSEPPADRSSRSRPAPEPAPQTRRPSPPARRSSGLPDRLHIALVRASGCNPNAPGAEAIFAQWPSSAELRGNPAAKRALWPTLRALRKASQS
ncbi:hypothetical protein [Pseudoxanthomonas dokdonensis]|uniref:Alanine acetyltransferase n=1 Tax=Pseudoxanthomonas dokdonensis TaxID=344882 RepID=A0A0R0CU55_9GAMM|nr:hypothetical protein [Pseudoxanthomonas dokdonensis]KRG69639.1 hypothetical protein ABB29_09225 [Pseudoxanthomonas dokdonensis]